VQLLAKFAVLVFQCLGGVGVIYKVFHILLSFGAGLAPRRGWGLVIFRRVYK
jgi:hypothetical protein